MSQYVGALWPILKSYRPNAAASPRSGPAAKRFGAFEATYFYPHMWRRPQTNAEAQRLYNHIRTVAYWLDASPLLSDLGLPFKAGLDDIISLVPFYGDIFSGILQLYQVFLSFLFGVDLQVIGWMFLTVLLDTVIGVVPILGDYLDYLFKSNLRNLLTLEEWLLNSPNASRYSILLMPESGNKNDFIPSPPKKSSFNLGSWGKSAAASADSAARAASGKTRRMAKDEGYATAAYAADVDQGGSTGTTTGVDPHASAGKTRTRSRKEPAF